MEPKMRHRISKTCVRCHKKKPITSFKKSSLPSRAGDLNFNPWCNNCIKITSRLVEL